MQAPTGSAWTASELDEIASAPFFKGLPRATLQKVAARAKRRDFAPGELVIAKGETTIEMSCIVSGSVEVFLDLETAPIGCLTTGDIIVKHLTTGGVKGRHRFYFNVASYSGSKYSANCRR